MLSRNTSATLQAGYYPNLRKQRADWGPKLTQPSLGRVTFKHKSLLVQSLCSALTHREPRSTRMMVKGGGGSTQPCPAQDRTQLQAR